MKKHLRLIASAFGIAVVLVALDGCKQLTSTPFDVSVNLAATQYPGAQNSDGSFSILFPSVTSIQNASLPAGAEIASSGTYLGATVAELDVKTNETFFLTGARIENVRYELLPVGGTNPIGTSSDIAYVNPTLGEISPIFPDLALGVNGGNLAVDKVYPNQDNYFDLGLSSALSLWNSIDVDRNGVYFPQDQSEVIHLTCSVFLQGYLPDGTEFTGNFPPPLLLKLVVEHSP